MSKTYDDDDADADDDVKWDKCGGDKSIFLGAMPGNRKVVLFTEHRSVSRFRYSDTARLVGFAG